MVRAQVSGRPRPLLRGAAQGRGQQLLEGGLDVRCVRGRERGGIGSGRAAAVIGGRGRGREERAFLYSCFFSLFSLFTPHSLIQSFLRLKLVVDLHGRFFPFILQVFFTKAAR